MSQPWHAAFRSIVERITVVIGPSSEGREKGSVGRWMIPHAKIWGPA
jgi:hypothetical protein